MKSLYVFFMVMVLLNNYVVVMEILYGASVHWRPSSVNGTSKNDAITLSYKLIWRRGPLPQCPPVCFVYLNGQTSATVYKSGVLNNPRWNGYKWKCVGGCSTSRIISNLSELYFTDIDTFHNISWEAAIEMITFEFNKGDDRANIKIGLFDASDNPVDGLAEGRLNMAIRNDTMRANISPAINPLPYYRVPLGCSITIPLFPFDGDGDYVRCHWQKFPKEGTVESSTILNEDRCELSLVADPKTGFTANENFSFALYAEDYSIMPVHLSRVSDDITTGPFSRTPFLIVLYIGEATPGCIQGPDFIQAGTLPPNFVGSYPLPFQNAKLPFKIPSDDNHIVLTSGPRYMAFGFNKVTETFEGTWKDIKDAGMTGIHQACGMSYTKLGVPGEVRCAVLLVNEPNECPCPPQNDINGTCRNLFEYHTCDYSNMTYIQLQTISQLLQSVAEQKISNQQLQDTCQRRNSDDDDNIKLILGLPIGLSLLLLIIIIVTACVLKHYIDKKKQNTSINPGDTPKPSTGPPSVW